MPMIQFNLSKEEDYNLKAYMLKTGIMDKRVAIKQILANLKVNIKVP